MIDLKGTVSTLNNKEYFFICSKKIGNRELYIAAALTPPQGLQVLDIVEDDNGTLQGRLYKGEDHDAIIEESKDELVEFYVKSRWPEG